MNEQIASVPKKIMFAPTIPITTQPIQLMFRPPKEDRRGQPAACCLVLNISIMRTYAVTVPVIVASPLNVVLFVAPQPSDFSQITYKIFCKILTSMDVM